MGYTCGRKHTEESLREIAKLYNTRSEFQKKDPSAYSSANRRGNCFLNSICEHMVNGSYSTPQLICKKIMEKLLGIKCLYNTKSIITPYELDIYFPNFKLAIEYNGKGWHNSEDAKRRDSNKKILCDRNGITLIYIEENNRDYEKDVKNQLILNLEIINKITNNNFSNLDINKIDCCEIYDDILKTRNIEEIKNKILSCSSIKEFRNKHPYEYNFLIKIKKKELLKKIKQTKEYSENELLEECKRISNYSDLLKKHSNIYQCCVRRGLLDKATAHMKKMRSPYKNYTNEKLLDMANKFEMKSYLKRKNTPLYLELIKRDILKLVIYDPNFVYKSSRTLSKENILEKCFEDAKKYDNYYDFKNDKNLYDLCVKYKIIRKIIKKFPKKNIGLIILEESKKYENFKEFTKSIWYIKSKKIKGLIQKIKKQNNWSFKTKENINYIEKYPNVVKMINDKFQINDIYKMTGVNKTTIWRLKVQMHKKGILKNNYKFKKKG